MLGEPCLSPQSALAEGCWCDTEPGTVQGSLQLLEGSLEPGSVPRTPRAPGQSQVPPKAANSPRFLLGRAGESVCGRGSILNGKHPQKSFLEASPVSLGVCDPSLAPLAHRSPQQQVLSPGQARMSPQRSGCDSERGAAGPPNPTGGRRREGDARGCTPAPKRCHRGRACPATRHRAGKCRGGGLGDQRVDNSG